MSRTRLLLLCLTLAALSACGGGQQSTMPPTDPQSGTIPQTAPMSTDASQPDAMSTTTTNDTAAPGSTTGADTMSAGAVVPEATTSVPKHIPTYAMDEYYGEGSLGTSAQVREYLTYAEGGNGNAKAVADCATSGGACHSVFYFNPSLLYDNTLCGVSGAPADLMRHATEAWFVHVKGYTDKAHRLYSKYPETCQGKSADIPIYAINTINSAVRSYFTSYMHTYAGAWDYWFMDNTHGTVRSQFYAGGGMCYNASGHTCTTTQEVPTDASVVAEHADLANSLTHTNGAPMLGFYNSLSYTNHVPDLNVMSSSSHFTGTVCESCVVSLGTFRPQEYADVLTTMAKVNATASGHFVLLSQGVSPAGSAAQIAQRAITTAVAWLGYSQAHTVVFPNLEANTTQLNIFPEDSIVPMSPLQTMTSGATNLEVASGVYRREFASCYNNGVAIGPCAAIVNATGGNVVIRSSWLHEAYGHVVQIVGGTIGQSGHVSLTTTRFVPNSTYIAPAQGMMITR